MQTQQKTSKNPDWDTVNSILCASFYYKNQLMNYSTGKLMTKVVQQDGKDVTIPMKYQKRYFKPMHDAKYPSNGKPEERVQFEVSGIIRNILVDMKNRNIYKEAQIYRNLNGGYKESGNNKLIVTLHFDGKSFEVKYAPNVELPSTYMEIFDQSFDLLRNLIR